MRAVLLCKLSNLYIMVVRLQILHLGYMLVLYSYYVIVQVNKLWDADVHYCLFCMHFTYVENLHGIYTILDDIPSVCLSASSHNRCNIQYVSLQFRISPSIQYYIHVRHTLQGTAAHQKSLTLLLNSFPWSVIIRRGSPIRWNIVSNALNTSSDDLLGIGSASTHFENRHVAVRI